MRLLLSALFSLATLAVSAQTIQYFDEDRKPTFDKSLAKTYTETITGDSLVASVKTYTIDGKLQQEKNYSNLRKGILDGPSKSWFENGQLRQEQFFINGKQERYSKTYYPNGQLKRNEIYKNGAIMGGKILYHSWKRFHLLPFCITS